MKIFAAKCEDELTEKDLKELVSSSGCICGQHDSNLNVMSVELILKYQFLCFEEKD